MPIKKHLSNNQEAELQSELAKFSFALTPAHSEKIAHYLELLYAWNERANLTRIPSENAMRGHILDSIIPFLRLHSAGIIQLQSEIQLADVGSGGGVPGIPLAIFFPHWKVTLIESSSRKNTFLSTASSLLGLGAGVIAQRVENHALAPDMAGAFDLVTARALAPMPLLAEYLLPLVKPKGIVAALKSATIDGEIEDAKDTIKKLGGLTPQIVPYGLGGDSLTSSRCVVVIKKS
jgi:16S rRNA (guanine527-N7)-methyltransferase